MHKQNAFQAPPAAPPPLPPNTSVLTCVEVPRKTRLCVDLHVKEVYGDEAYL